MGCYGVRRVRGTSLERRRNVRNVVAAILRRESFLDVGTSPRQGFAVSKRRGRRGRRQRFEACADSYSEPTECSGTGSSIMTSSFSSSNQKSYYDFRSHLQGQLLPSTEPGFSWGGNCIPKRYHACVKHCGPTDPFPPRLELRTERRKRMLRHTASSRADLSAQCFRFPCVGH